MRKKFGTGCNQTYIYVKVVYHFRFCCNYTL